MWTSTFILSEGADDLGQLAYVIALLVLGGITALADWLRKRQQASSRGSDVEKGRPESSTGEPTVDLERWREILMGPGEKVPPRPSPPEPPPHRPATMEAPPAPRRPAPMPARRPTKARPAPVAEETPARPPRLGEQVLSRKVGREVGQVAKRALAEDVQQAIAKMTSETVVSPVSETSPKPRTAAPPAAALVGPATKMSTIDLRRAFVMSEVLQPPLALRE